MYDLLCDGDGRELFYQPLGGYQTYNFDFFRASMEHPNVLFGLSDGGAHCGVIADAGMPTFILTHWGRDRRKGERMPLEFLVRKLSRDTAEAYGMTDRGLLAPGMLADVNVIDFDALPCHGPRRVRPAHRRQAPGAAGHGYEHIVKRGEPIMERGERTAALPGRLVRGG
jgi:N-acyl-D-amino-acid deacylase